MTKLIALHDPSSETDNVHIAGAAGTDYATICGCAVDGDEYSCIQIPLQKGAQIDCVACCNIYLACRSIRLKDIKP